MKERRSDPDPILRLKRSKQGVCLFFSSSASGFCSSDGALLKASFGFHLAMDTLAVRLAVPLAGPAIGLEPTSKCALPGAHSKKAALTSGLDENTLTFLSYLRRRSRTSVPMPPRMPSAIVDGSGTSWKPTKFCMVNADGGAVGSVGGVYENGSDWP